MRIFFSKKICFFFATITLLCSFSFVALAEEEIIFVPAEVVPTETPVIVTEVPPILESIPEIIPEVVPTIDTEPVLPVEEVIAETPVDVVTPEVVDVSVPDIEGNGSPEENTPVVEPIIIQEETPVSVPASEVIPNRTPNIDEQSTDNGKVVVVSSTPEQDAVAPMVDIPVLTEIPEIFRVGQEDQIKIKWVNNENQEMQFLAYDNDNDGLIDHVGWTVPHLSVQTFEIIFISKALQLDSDKNTIADIYDLVSAKDQNYAHLIDGQYVRVTFEKLLDSTKDITLYAKGTDENPSAFIEVYTTDGTLLGSVPPPSS